MTKYLEWEELTVDEIKSAIRKGTLAVKFFPVMCGTALGNKGVKLLKDVFWKFGFDADFAWKYIWVIWN